MTTYANIKLSEIFALYGNPFTRGTCKKNIRAKIINKHFKKINFEEIINNDNTESKSIKEGNSKILLLNNKKDNGLMLLKNVFTEQNNINKTQSFIISSKFIFLKCLFNIFTLIFFLHVPLVNGFPYKANISLNLIFSYVVIFLEIKYI